MEQQQEEKKSTVVYIYNLVHKVVYYQVHKSGEIIRNVETKIEMTYA